MPTGEIDLYEHLDSVIAASATMLPLETLLSGLVSLHAQNLGMNASQQKSCLDLVQASAQSDKVTGLYDALHDTLMVKAANKHTEIKQKDAFIIAGDFSNLYNANQALSKTRTNEIMAIIIDIYKQEFNLAAPDLVYGSRSGGDEFRFVVSGLSEEKLKVGIEKAQQRIGAFVSEMGLGAIQHSKHPGVPEKAGIGAGVAYKKLPVDFPSYELDSELDEAINKEKYEIGKRKINKIPLHWKSQVKLLRAL